MKLFDLRRLGAFLVFIVLLLTTACGGGTNSGNTTSATSAETTIQQTEAEKIDPLGKYDPPIDVNMGAGVWSAIKYIEGESQEDNPWTREYRDALGINIKYAWLVDSSQYDQKVNVVIASGDIPDLMGVNMKQYKMLLDAGLVQEYTDIFEKYALPITKTVFAGDKATWDAAQIGGKIFGIPRGGTAVHATLQEIFIRKDWLDKLNLQMPKTIDELVKIAEAFTTQDPDGNGKADTTGIALYKDINRDDAGNAGGLLGFFNGYHAYPNAWIEGADGKLVYGSIMPEMKSALQKLHEMYEVGAIDKEFAVKDINKYYEELTSGKAGIFYGQFWNTAWPLQSLKTADPKSEWETCVLVSADDKAAQVQANVSLTGFLVCSKKYEHPEAVVKLLNLMTA